ncbi:hypothetical protein ABH920_008494 [Catenulispora sp. EB89]
MQTTATLTPQPIDGGVVQGAVRRLTWTTYRGSEHPLERYWSVGNDLRGD